MGYFKTGYELCRGDADADTRRKLLTNLTAIYIYMGRLDEARKYQRASQAARGNDNSVNSFIMHSY